MTDSHDITQEEKDEMLEAIKGMPPELLLEMLDHSLPILNFIKKNFESVNDLNDVLNILSYATLATSVLLSLQPDDEEKDKIIPCYSCTSKVLKLTNFCLEELVKNEGAYQFGKNFAIRGLQIDAENSTTH